MAILYDAIITQQITDRTETSISVYWSVAGNPSNLWYTIDNGETWVNVGSVNKSNGVYTIRGLQPKTDFSIKTRLQFPGYTFFTVSGEIKATTYDWPHCTDAPSFTIGEDVTLTFYNPLKRNCLVSITCNGKNITIGTLTGGTSYTIHTGDEDIKTAIYNTIQNTWTAKYFVNATYDSHTSAGDIKGWYEANPDDCKPIFTAFDCYDSNDTVCSVTGDNKVFVKGLSNINVVITGENKMVTRYGATPVNYGALTVDIDNEVVCPYSDSDVNIDVKKLNNVGTQQVTVTAYDSRRIFTVVHKEVEVHDYKIPVLHVTAERKNNFENETTLKVSGTYSPIVVDGAEKNALTSLSYRYYEVSGNTVTIVGAGGFNFTASNGRFECEDTLLNLDNSKEYKFVVDVIDKFGKVGSVTTFVGVGQAVFFVSSNLKKCFINGEEVATVNSVQLVDDEVPSKAEIIDYTHPVGSVFITNTNTNPSTLLGCGSWTLIDKEFTPSSGSSTDLFAAAELVENGGTYVVRGGHTIRIRQLVTPYVALDDTDFVLGSFIWTQMGVNNIAADIIDKVAYADGANGGIVCYVSRESGVLTSRDIFDAAATTDKKFYLELVIVVDHTRMIDTFCNKFYWKRTS